MTHSFPLLLGFQGVQPSDPGVQEVAQALIQGHVAGVIFFAGNMESPAQVTALTRFFKESGSLPPLIALDQEGGRVQRLSSKNGFRDFLSAKEVAQRCTPEEAYGYYCQMARQTQEAGFNYVLGPVVDLDTPDSPAIGGMNRSYGSDPEVVARYASAFVRAHHDHGLLISFKHFPGHGLATGDTHRGLVDVTETFEAGELEPFKILINQGLADSIMTAHVLNRHWDGDYPATLSPLILKGILREKLGYDGVVVTDDLHMGALQTIPTHELMRQAILAGNDLLLFSNNPLARKGMPQEDVEQVCEQGLLASLAHVQETLAQDPTFIPLIGKAYERVTRLRKIIADSL